MNLKHWPQAFGQSLWLDNITRDLLDNHVLQRYIDEFAITGLTSNPTIFDDAFAHGAAYDPAIAAAAQNGQTDEELFVDLALADLCRAADLFRPAFEATGGIDGWVSMEVSPTLVDDAPATIAAAASIFRQAARPNLFVKIPGTPAGVIAIEESIFAGVPVNVTLLFSREQYLAAAGAYLRGIERRLDAGYSGHIASVASVFVSRWDKTVGTNAPVHMRNQLGIAIAGRTYRAHRDLLASARWRRLAAKGARPQRLLWASTGTKDPAASETLYVESLIAPETINTLPEKTLAAFAAQGQARNAMPADGVAAEATLTRFKDIGIDLGAVAQKLQHEGAQSFLKSWQHLMRSIASKRSELADARQRA